MQVSLYNFSPGESSRVLISVWYAEDAPISKFEKSYPLVMPTERGKKAQGNGAQGAKPIIAYDSEICEPDCGELFRCARVQVKLYDFSPGESARIGIKVHMFCDPDDDMPAPDAKLQKSAKGAKARAAARGAERAEWMSEPTMEIWNLKQQLEELDEDEEVQTTEEYDAIIQRLKQLEAESKKTAAGEANERETFTCAICLDREPLSALHVVVPCGHGFCGACTSTLEASIVRARRAQEQNIPGCYNCRGPVVSVCRTYL